MSPVTIFAWAKSPPLLSRVWHQQASLCHAVGMREGRKQRIILSLLKTKDLTADFQGLLKHLWSPAVCLMFCSSAFHMLSQQSQLRPALPLPWAGVEHQKSTWGWRCPCCRRTRHSSCAGHWVGSDFLSADWGQKWGLMENKLFQIVTRAGRDAPGEQGLFPVDDSKLPLKLEGFIEEKGV